MHMSRLLGAGILGAVLAGIWSFHFVDSVIGDNVANTLLGGDAKAMPLTSMVSGALFALATGMAGTFTACNVCVLSAVAPAAAGSQSRLDIFRPVLFMLIGALIVSILYGSIGVMTHQYLPQMADTTYGGYPSRLLQAGIVFVPIGIVMIMWGIAIAKAGGLGRSAFAQQWPMAPYLFMGILFGAFLIGRPFPLFRKMFGYAIEQGQPLYGALTFSLQAIGNMALVAVMILAIGMWGGRFKTWLAQNAASIASFTFVMGGAFFVAYWGLRTPARFGFGWYPMINW